MRLAVVCTAAMAAPGCQVGVCASDANGVEPPIDAGVDAPAFRRPDTGTCDGIRPARLGFATVNEASSPVAMTQCFNGVYRVRVFRAGETVAVFDELVSCRSSIGEFPPGEYDIAVEANEDPRWVSGTVLTRPASCPAGRPREPHCGAQRISLAPCDDRRIYVVLYCDDNVGTCTPVTWPWEVSP